MYRKFFIAVILYFNVISGYFCSGAEIDCWSSWRGPSGNGKSTQSAWSPEAIEGDLKQKWKKNIGPGYSCVSIYGPKAYTLGYDTVKNENILYCLSAETGKEIWRYSYKATKGGYSGPRTTPVIDDKRVYTLGQDGEFMCNDALTGRLIWKRQAADEFQASQPKWMFASSIFIYGDMAVANAGRYGVALNKITGKVVWKSPPGTANYSTPVLYRINGKDCFAIFGKKELFGIDAASGKELWSYPWETSWDVNAADPAVYGSKVFISSGYGKGCVLLDISSGRPVEVWRNKNLSSHFASPIIIGDYVYGISGNAGTDASLVCISLKDGSIKWSHDAGFGNMIVADNKIIMLTERGDLHISEASPVSYKEISSRKNLLPKLCWTAPVLCGSDLYLRNDKGDLRCLDLSE